MRVSVTTKNAPVQFKNSLSATDTKSLDDVDVIRLEVLDS